MRGGSLVLGGSLVPRSGLVRGGSVACFPLACRGLATATHARSSARCRDRSHMSPATAARGPGSQKQLLLDCINAATGWLVRV
eukprot:scaffold117006_cov71-Phaeocystis_antarctica.AAC.1